MNHGIILRETSNTCNYKLFIINENRITNQ